MAKYYGEGSGEGYTFIKRLNFGYYFDFVDGSVCLLLKLEPSLMMSVIEGKAMSIIIRNSNLDPRGSTLYIWDDKNRPAFIPGNSFGLEDGACKGFDQWAIKLASMANEITVCFFNHNNHNFFSTELKIESDHAGFEAWLFKVYNDPGYKDERLKSIRGDFTPEDVRKGFSLKILNVNNRQSPKIKFGAPEYKAGALKHPLTQKPYFDYADYLNDGRHGTLQEMCLTSKLDVLFKTDHQLFVSPRYENGLEFTDFLLFDGDCVMVIESKFILSDKPTKRHSNISKAINQLMRVELEVKRKNCKLQGEQLQEMIGRMNHVLKICVINDRIDFDDAYASLLAKQFEKPDLPIFISITAFTNLLTGLNLKNPDCLSYNLFSNLISYYVEFLDSDRNICWFGGFSIENLSIKELNDMGKNRSSDLY
jgi:hypothetical protein